MRCETYCDDEVTYGDDFIKLNGQKGFICGINFIPDEKDL